MASSCCRVSYMNEGAAWVTGSVDTPEGEVPCISSRFSWSDRLSWWRVRWGIGRMGMAVLFCFDALETGPVEQLGEMVSNRAPRFLKTHLAVDLLRIQTVYDL